MLISLFSFWVLGLTLASIHYGMQYKRIGPLDYVRVYTSMQVFIYAITWPVWFIRSIFQALSYLCFALFDLTEAAWAEFKRKWND